MGAKLEKFVRHLKKLRHSYIKQPLAKDLEILHSSAFIERLFGEQDPEIRS